MSFIYYVYELTNSLSGEVFYVGKGQNARMHHHRKAALRGEKSRKGSYIRKLIEMGGDVVASVVQRFDDENEALEFEKHLIAEYGLERLLNILPGGTICPEKLEAIKQAKARAKESYSRLSVKRQVSNPSFYKKLRHRMIYWASDLNARNMVGTGEQCIKMFIEFIMSLEADVQAILLEKAGLSLKTESNKTITLTVHPWPEAA